MNFADRNKIISENLRKSKKVNSFDTDKERESDTLAHSLVDMEGSFKEILNNLLPKLNSKDILEGEVDGTLWDIGEELRHILYHIRDPKFYGYLE